MSFSAFIPVANLIAANAALEAQGHGAECFSVAYRGTSDTGDATHAALYHIADDAVFQAHVAAIPGVVLTTAGTMQVAIAAHATAQALEWTDPVLWFENPVMTGDRRTHGGKEWESLVDYNVWTPPVAWREVVAEGYPAWVAPTGAHDAYALGARVTHNGQNWENTGSAANVWEPGVFGWVVI